VLDEELKRAASDEEVKAALADKISRERIGHEVCSGFTTASHWDVSFSFILLLIDFNILNAQNLRVSRLRVFVCFMWVFVRIFLWGGMDACAHCYMWK